jgi:heme-degrading monooxygenase HmoA
MYGTIARLQIKPGAEAEIDRTIRDTALEIPGFVFQHMYKSDANPNEYFLVVGFTNREAYVANANSPEQAERYEGYMKLMDAAPEWHDGEIVSSSPA